ncbi:MAG TPA: hypothetical protein VLH09_10145 [Bryobacteraceae bacterium]|nr:hypothetical protein [Bryobacteraceae bacterium]
MSWDWVLHPALQLGLQAAGLALCLHLFLSAKQEARRGDRRAAEHRRKVDGALQSVEQAVEQIRSGLAEVSELATKLVEPPPAASGLNLTKRSQALRMHRRGESPEHIAAALAMPLGEVELLLKVEQIGADVV